MVSAYLENITKHCGINMHPEEIKVMRQALMEMLLKLRINEQQEDKQALIRNMLLKIK